MSASTPHPDPYDPDRAPSPQPETMPTEAGGRFASPLAGQLRRLAALSAARRESRLEAEKGQEAPQRPADAKPAPTNGEGRPVSGPRRPTGGCGGGQQGAPKDPRREQHVACLVCRWVEGLAGYIRRQVEGGVTIDRALLSAGMAVVGQMYAALTGIIRSHLLGWCGGRRLTARRTICEACPYRAHVPLRGIYCGAERCDCPQVWWWPFGRLGYKQTLRAWRCPIGAWRLGPKAACEGFARFPQPAKMSGPVGGDARSI